MEISVGEVDGDGALSPTFELLNDGKNLLMPGHSFNDGLSAEPKKNFFRNVRFRVTALYTESMNMF